MAEKRSFNNPGSSLRTLIESAIRTDQREQAKQCTMLLDSLAAMLAEHRGEWHRKMGDNLPRFQLLDVPRELFVLVLRAAVRQGHKPCARIILEEELATPEEAKMQLGGTPILHTACARAHGPLAEWLVSSGTCGVNRLDAEGTPAIVWAARSGKVGVVAALTRAGEGACEVNCPDGRGYSALIWAAANNSAGVVDLLIKRGADVDFVAPNGTTAVWAASNAGAAAALLTVLARHDSAKDFCRLKAPCCTAMDWMFIPAYGYCFALP